MASTFLEDNVGCASWVARMTVYSSSLWFWRFKVLTNGISVLSPYSCSWRLFCSTGRFWKTIPSWSTKGVIVLPWVWRMVHRQQPLPSSLLLPQLTQGTSCTCMSAVILGLNEENSPGLIRILLEFSPSAWAGQDRYLCYQIKQQHSPSEYFLWTRWLFYPEECWPEILGFHLQYWIFQSQL